MITSVILQMVIRVMLTMSHSMRMMRIVMRTVATRIVVLMMAVAMMLLVLMTLRKMTRTPMMMMIMSLLTYELGECTGDLNKVMVLVVITRTAL